MMDVNLNISHYHQDNQTIAKELFEKVVKQNKKHTLSYLYLYKIAKLNDNRGEMDEYQSIINQLDSNIDLANE